MTTPQDDSNPQVDEEARERSAEQRNITAPTPQDVRAKADDESEKNGGEERPTGEAP